MKMIITILSAIFLSNCGTIEPIRPLVMCDVSFRFERCLCRCYDLMKLATVDPKECGREDIIGQSWREPIDACDGISGFQAKDWSLYILPSMKDAQRRGKWLDQNRRGVVKSLVEESN